MVRVVATCTTIPTRYERLRKMIESLVNQTYKLDAIYVGLPKRSHRLKLEYPPLPDDIKKNCIVVVPKIDYGPITKLYGGLVSEKDPETLIISFDDDIVYPPTTVETFVKHAQEWPDRVITATGMKSSLGYIFRAIETNLGPTASFTNIICLNDDGNGNDIDEVYGVTGVLYRLKFFPSNNRIEKELFSYVFKDKNIFLNDDLLISGYLDYKGIKRRAFNDFPRISFPSVDSNALSFSISNQMESYNKALKAIQKLGLFPRISKPKYDELAFSKASVFLIIIIGLIICSVLAVYYILRNVNVQDFMIYYFM